MDVIRIYFDLLDNVFFFLTLELFAEFRLETYDFTKKRKLRIIYLIYYILYAIPADLPSIFDIISISLTFLYIYLIAQKKTSECIKIFLKYEFITAIAISLLIISHTYIINDFKYLTISENYDNAKDFICTILLYAGLYLYINTKRFFGTYTKKRYVIYFSAAVLLSCYILSYINLLLLSIPRNGGYMLPIIYSFFLIIIAVCLNAYQKIVLTLKENARQKIIISRYETEKAYYKDIEKSLKNLSSLRHDFKNHLLVLDSYAKKGDLQSLISYIAKFNTDLEDTKLIQSPNSLVSAILNAKSNICSQKNIAFSAICTFASIFISDFHLITILGNILDNAVSAASKISGGHIDISLCQVDSYLEIRCENNHAENIRRKNGQFLTTKEGNSMFHGIGIKNIQKSVEELNGTMDIQYTEATFHVNILVPNYH